MTDTEFEKAIEAAAPGSAIEELSNGELVIYTGRLKENGTVRLMTQDEING